ncbi:hypothetical protein ACIQGW_05095 [Lysinibacillus xylanilyticus]|uniref:hypothetical protein n=1 Tax=Lysinibacillus xylanilyticus TaxID=582475 RepID=UPI0038018150
MKFYRVKPESEYYQNILKAKNAKVTLREIAIKVQEHFQLPYSPSWSITPDYYYHDLDVLNDEQLKAFKKNGIPKKSNKLGAQIIAFHKELISKEGLEGLRTESDINFSYGVMRRSQNETLESLNGLDTRYIKTNSNCVSSKDDFLEEITEAEYVKAYLAAVEAKEGAKNETKV